MSLFMQSNKCLKSSTFSLTLSQVDRIPLINWNKVIYQDYCMIRHEYYTPNGTLVPTIDNYHELSWTATQACHVVLHMAITNNCFIPSTTCEKPYTAIFAKAWILNSIEKIELQIFQGENPLNETTKSKTVEFDVSKGDRVYTTNYYDPYSDTWAVYWSRPTVENVNETFYVASITAYPIE